MTEKYYHTWWDGVVFWLIVISGIIAGFTFIPK